MKGVLKKIDEVERKDKNAKKIEMERTRAPE